MRLAECVSSDACVATIGRCAMHLDHGLRDVHDPVLPEAGGGIRGAFTLRSLLREDTAPSMTRSALAGCSFAVVAERNNGDVGLGLVVRDDGRLNANGDLAQEGGVKTIFSRSIGLTCPGSFGLMSTSTP